MCSSNVPTKSTNIRGFQWRQSDEEFLIATKKQALTTKHFQSVENIKDVSVVVTAFSITEDLNTAWKNIWKFCSELIIEGQAQLFY